MDAGAVNHVRAAIRRHESKPLILILQDEISDLKVSNFNFSKLLVAALVSDKLAW